jgi:hypothetical protein
VKSDIVAILTLELSVASDMISSALQIEWITKKVFFEMKA